MRPGPASLPLALFACVIHPTSFLPTEPPSSPSPLPRPGWGVEEAGELGMALPLGWLTVLGVPPHPRPGGHRAWRDMCLPGPSAHSWHVWSVPTILVSHMLTLQPARPCPWRGIICS